MSSNPMNWGQPPAPMPMMDPAESLRRIEAHTAELVTWIKYLTGAVIILVIVTALLFA